MSSVNAGDQLHLNQSSLRDKLASTTYDVIKSARNTEIQDVDPLPTSKDDGSPNFVVHP